LSAAVTYALMWVGFVAYLAVLVRAPRLGRRLVWATIVVAVTAFAVAPVLLSQDVYSYLSYARLGVVHGLDPYSNPPAAVPTDPVYPEVGWTEETSSYGPLFTLLTYPLAWLPIGTAVALLKVVAALCVLGLAALTCRLASARGVDPLRAAAFVALNPLVLVHVVGGAHNDAIAVLLAFAGCAAVLAARELSGGVALASAAALKASVAFAAPFAVFAAAPSPMGRKRDSGSRFRPVGGLLAGAALALGAIGLAAYAAFGWSWLDGFAVVGENQGRVSNYSLPNLLSELLNVDVDTVRSATAVSYLVLLAALLRWTYRGGDWIRASGWAALGLLLATAWLLPWYVLWALPFAAISRDDRLVAAVLALTAVQLAARIPL
jgi:alpha-1,6-mannosyltransferase